jgi:multiple sugar transport system substrate-binding protein
MKSRLIAAAAVGTAALAAIAGCSSSSSTAASSGSSSSGSTGSSSTPVTINFYGADYGTPGTSNSSTKYWDSVATAFHAQYPNVTVKVTTIDWTDFLVKAPALIQAHQYPDIMEGEPAPQYAQSDLIYPVSQVLDSSTDSNLVQKFLDDTDYQNTPYGIPWTTSTRAMFYNKKAFAAAGIKAAPTTWAQLQADCPALKAKGYICYGMPLGSEEAQAELLLWFLGNGGGYVNSSGQYDINSPQNIQTLTFMKQLAAAGDTEPSVGTTDRKTVWAEFGNGKIAMCLGSPAVIASDLAPTGTLPLSDVGTAPVPGKTGPLTQTLGVHDDIVVFKNNDSATKLAAIKEFLDFAYQDKYQLQFDNEYDLLPATQTGATAMASENPMYAAFLSNISNSVNYPTNTNWGTVDSAIEQQVGAAINGSPSQVLNALQQTASQGG